MSSCRRKKSVTPNSSIRENRSLKSGYSKSSFCSQRPASVKQQQTVYTDYRSNDGSRVHIIMCLSVSIHTLVFCWVDFSSVGRVMRAIKNGSIRKSHSTALRGWLHFWYYSFFYYFTKIWAINKSNKRPFLGHLGAMQVVQAF